MIALARAEPTALFGFDVPVQHKQKSNEWYTPAKYLEAARAVMGGIELDPASCEEANLIVKAERFYTIKENGLTQEWKARSLWLNPPYSSVRAKNTKGLNGGKLKGYTGAFIQKLVMSYQYGDVTQTIACVNADVVRSWFQCLWEYVLCFPSRPISFLRPHREPEHHFFGTVFAYLGPYDQKFIDVFSAFGRIAKAIDPPKVRPMTREIWQTIRE